MLSWTAAVSSTCTRKLSSSLSGVGGGEWCFLLRGVTCVAGSVHVEAIPSDRLGIRCARGADVDWADVTVVSSGGPDVN